MTNKKNPFISSPIFTQGSKALEQERQEKINTSIEPAAKISERVLTQTEQSEPTSKKEKKGRQRKRFAVTIDEYIPAKYIKSGETSTVNAHEKILREFKLISLDKKISVEDLFNIAAYSFLLQTKSVKEEMLKPFEL